MRKELARIETRPRAISEMVKPAKRSGAIRIHNVTGCGGGSGGVSGGGEGKTPVKRTLGSIFGMAVQLPALKTPGDDSDLS